MAEFYKILKADPLGAPWTPNAPDAKPIQNYWCQVDGEELAVSIGKQVGNSITPGESVYGDLMKATSQKGTNYWKFKSQKVPEGVTRPASSPAQATAQQATGAAAYAQQWADNSGEVMPKWFVPVYNMITYIYQQMKAMDGDAVDEPEVAAPAAVTPTPVSAHDKAVLDGLFGKTETTTEPEPEV